MQLAGNLFLPRRFFVTGAVIVAILAAGFAFPLLFAIAKVVLLLFVILMIVDVLVLFNNRVHLGAERVTASLLSLGDDNNVTIKVKNNSGIPLEGIMIDELPAQLQWRDFNIPFLLKPGEEKNISYIIRPLERGEYEFGNIRMFIHSKIGLAERRITIRQTVRVPVYPSIIQMKQMELHSISKVSHDGGVKRLRRIGHSYEFEQIKTYVRGDDYRSINWKATGRKGELMVNQFQDERSQQIFCAIDNSRSMKLPFHGLSLFDYAINATLVISNVSLQKQDKAGLIVFSDKIETFLKPNRGIAQLKQLLDKLYKQQEKTHEANYEWLYFTIRKQVKNRSLFFLFTNFESSYSMERVLNILRKLNKLHLLVVVFFENTEVSDFSLKDASTTEEIYHQTIAQKMIAEKTQMVQQLKQYGIQSILTRPEQLTITTLNKYLELKSRGMI